MNVSTNLSALIESLLSDSNLLLAWSHVHQNAGSPGVDGVTVERYGEKAFTNLMELVQSLRCGTYVPDPVLRIWIDRPGKTPRGLGIPTVRDRVLQTALSQVLTPIFEKHFEDCSYAYRPARSLQMALSRIIEYREKGYQWVVDADIQHFFDEIPHPQLLFKLDSILHDSSVSDLITSWLCAPIKDGQAQHIPSKGIPQGSPISPLLANLYLTELDQALLREHYRVIRFADDFIVLCKTRPEAVQALHLSEDVLSYLSLKIEPEKTRITSFDEGFRFLGTDFIGEEIQSETINLDIFQSKDLPAKNKKIPPPDQSFHTDSTDSKKKDPSVSPVLIDEENFNGADHPSLRRTLYILEQGAFIGLRNNRIIIRHKGAEVRTIPLHQIDTIVLQGNQILSASLARACRETGTDIFFSTLPGNCDLRVDDLSGRQLSLLASQVKILEEPEAALALAKSLVSAKIANSREVLRQFNMRRQISDLHETDSLLKRLSKNAMNATDVDILRGIEGSAARHFFQGFGQFLPAQWTWSGRERRPPPDPVNAVLSYGYGFLYQNVLGALRRKGLSPYIGIYHAQRPGHPALASDLMEEFRSPVVDRMVLALFCEGKILPEYFTKTEESEICQLSSDLRRMIVSEFEACMNRAFIHPSTRAKTDYRRAIDLQAERYASFFRAKTPYLAFRMR